MLLTYTQLYLSECTWSRSAAASVTQEDDLIELAAKHLYVQHGSDCGPENVKAVVQECISTALLDAKSEAKWLQMVSTAHAQVSYST